MTSSHTLQVPPTPDSQGVEPAISRPLTYAQESLYFLHHLTRGEPAYNMPRAFRLRGALNKSALNQALRWVIARHEGLRMTVEERAGHLWQTAGQQGGPCFRLHQISPGELDEALQKAVREPFDLANGPLFRTDLFCLGDSESVFLLNLHHTMGDLTSLGIIFTELAEAYAAFSAGSRPANASKPFQLGEFAAECRAKEVSEETLAFWKGDLRAHTGELNLPADHPRPRYPSFRGAVYYFALPAATRAGLGEMARRNKSSLYMVFLAGLQALLFRYTGQEQFAIATPFSNRDDLRLEQTIGYLINLLPVACDVRAEKSFRELLGEVRAQCLDVYGHADISFQQIVRELGLSSDNPKPPLARVVFQYFPEIIRLDLPGLECEEIRVHTATSKFDLCVSMAEEKTGLLTTELEYDTDLFDEATIRRFARHFQNLLEAVSREAEQPIGDIRLLDEEEENLIEQWSAPRVPYPRDQTVHALFEEQAVQHPRKTALRFGDQEVSYSALNERADSIAAELQAAGIKTGDFVGVCLDRSPDLIAALVGILKAGAAFVPFEASYPKSRLDYLFRDSEVHLLVTDSLHASIAPSETKVVLLDQALPPVTGSPVLSKAGPESVAYMMYTSGSTGNPKGALIPHRAIVRLVKNNDFASLGSNEVFLAFAPVSFDASTLEIWGALLNGATLVIYPPQFESVEQFSVVIERTGVTTLWLTSGLFNTIVDQKVEGLRGVRQLLVGGDVLSVAHIQKALAALPETQLINGYGPTENTTFSCCYRIPRDLPSDRPVPIGRPIQNTSVYLLDERLRRVPIGVPGDLYTGGDGLSLGYWKNPELTAQNFLQNPFNPSQRLYKTGDRARFLEDGNIEFLGRRDSQVKIRGFRVEIEEVETALRKLAAVQDAAVAPHADQTGSKSLVAYVVLKQDRPANAQEILTDLGRHLPAHACPTQVVFLSELPLNPNGKVNRGALPHPAEFATSNDLARPMNEIEVKLIGLWQQILEIPALSIDDNFFLVGGESLRATRAISQMNAAFNCRLSLPRLFEAPTVRQMARLVQNSRERSEGSIKARSRSDADSLPDVSRLSDQDVDALLAQLLANDDSAQK